MEPTDPFARRQIVQVASQMVMVGGSRSLSLVDVAQRANVDVAIVQHFFDSRVELVAEAQMANYFAMVEPLHATLSRVEAALVEGDEVAFWAGVELNLGMAWSSGQINEKWGIMNLLHDIWSDPFTQGHFCELLDIQFDRWVAVVEGAKGHGWVSQNIDSKALTAVLWSASVGQVITAGSKTLDPTPDEIRDFCLGILRGQGHEAPSPVH